MIISPSRFAQAKVCWKKTFNLYHRHLGVPRTPQLVDGTAFHTGIAHWLTTRDTVAALKVARTQFDKDITLSTIPPEQSYLIQDNWDVVETALLMVSQEALDWTVVQPECKFEVPLEDSEHNCILKHWVDGESGFEHWGPPPANKILAGLVKSPHSQLDSTCECHRPHILSGATDVLVNWRGFLWLVDWKTTSIQGEQFWTQYQLDHQPTAYIYGVWKATGLKPNGVIINAIRRPSDTQVSAWNSKRKNGPPKTMKDYIGFEREPFTRTDKDLLRMKREMTQLCNEWEWRIQNGYFGMSPINGACRNYNRLCEYHSMCLSHDDDQAGLVQLGGDEQMGSLKLGRMT